MIKRIFIIAAVFCLVLFISACKKTESDKNVKQNTPEETNTSQIQSDDLQALSLASDLPACPADTSQIFTVPFMDEGLPLRIIPLGNSNESGHVVPVDHIYPYAGEYTAEVPVYAPSDMTLIWVEIKQKYYKSDDSLIGNDYQINMVPCRGINLSMVHYTKLSPKLAAAVHEENLNCSQEKTEEDEQSWYYTCHPNFDRIQLKAGEIIGYMGKLGPKNMHVDYGLYDYNKPALGFANPDRYYTFTNHAYCLTDYYTPELKAKYSALFGDMRSQGSDTQVFVAKTTEPVCGKIMYDIPGTAAGNWFKNPVTTKNVTDNNNAMILIHDNVETQYAKFTVSNVTGFWFIPKHAGLIDREYSEVTADGKVYCYDDNRTNGQEKILLQLIDDTHIQIEQQLGRCGASESFQNPITYER
ncbi:MAG: hypothetical protein WC528_03415 [Patescibacteria group bacterium]